MVSIAGLIQSCLFLRGCGGKPVSVVPDDLEEGGSIRRISDLLQLPGTLA